MAIYTLAQLLGISSNIRKEFVRSKLPTRFGNCQRLVAKLQSIEGKAGADGLHA